MTYRRNSGDAVRWWLIDITVVSDLGEIFEITTLQSMTTVWKNASWKIRTRFGWWQEGKEEGQWRLLVIENVVVEDERLGSKGERSWKGDEEEREKTGQGGKFIPPGVAWAYWDLLIPALSHQIQSDIGSSGRSAVMPAQEKVHILVWMFP